MGPGDLAPEGKQVADAVLAAAERKRPIPGDWPRWSVNSRPPRKPVFAPVDGLRRARGAAVGPLVAALADATRAAEHPIVRAMLVELGDDAIEPLLGVLDAADPKLPVQVIPVLAELNVRRAIPFLLAPCTAPQTAPEVRKAATEAVTRLIGHAPTQDEAAQLL